MFASVKQIFFERFSRSQVKKGKLQTLVLSKSSGACSFEICVCKEKQKEGQRTVICFAHVKRARFLAKAEKAKKHQENVIALKSHSEEFRQRQQLAKASHRVEMTERDS